MSVTLLINFSRSGGTILSRCLACIPDVILVSEVHPVGCAMDTIKDQVKKWYNINLQEEDFLGSVIELEKICSKSDLHLVIRDFTFNDFIPNELNGYKARNRLSTMEMLNNELKVKTFVLVRDSIDVWISRWKPEKFFEAYKKYVDEILNHNLQVFKFEDFCENPARIIREICNNSGIRFSESYKEYNNYTNITGDNLLKEQSRGAKQVNILPLKRKQLSNTEIKWLNSNQDMIEANTKLNYPINYYDREIEKRYNKWKIEIAYIFRMFSGRKAKTLY